jgi:hypothetical protein
MGGEMDYEDEINALSAQTIAIQAVIAHLMEKLLILGDPRLAVAVRGAFDEAAREIEDLAIQGSKSSDPRGFVKALSVVENLRTAAIGDHDKPKGVV